MSFRTHYVPEDMILAFQRSRQLFFPLGHVLSSRGYSSNRNLCVRFEARENVVLRGFHGKVKARRVLIVDDRGA